MKVTHVKKAMKDVPNSDIKAGESYYWWKFRYGGKRVSRTYPKRSQLTQSDFLSQLYDLQDEISECSASDKDEFGSLKEDFTSRIETLKDECQEKLDGMPEHLQESSSSGQLLTERIEALENWYSEIDGIECEDYDEDQLKEEIQEENPQEEGQSDDDYEAFISMEVSEKIEEFVNEALSQLQEVDSGL